jgi:hypothetical protein
MFDTLRKPFFLAAVALMLLALLLEISSVALVDLGDSASAQLAHELDVETPGYGIPSLALFDGFLVFGLALMTLSLWMPDSVLGRIQGIAGMVFSIVMIVAALTVAWKAFVQLSIMLTLLLSPIFGTAAYFAIFANFDRPGAQIALSLIMALKLAFAVCLVLAHQRFLRSKGLVFAIVLSLVLTIAVSFLHGFPPRFLASITDGVAGLIIAIIAILWGIIVLITSVVAIIKAIA